MLLIIDDDSKGLAFPILPKLLISSKNLLISSSFGLNSIFKLFGLLYFFKFSSIIFTSFILFSILIQL